MLSMFFFVRNVLRCDINNKKVVSSIISLRNTVTSTLCLFSKKLTNHSLKVIIVIHEVYEYVDEYVFD